MIIALHLGLALSGRPLYRPTYIGTALEYARKGIDLLNPVIVGFNAAGTPTLQEFPLWQALTALCFSVFGPWPGWGNVVSLLLFGTCVFPLFKLAREHLGERGGWWALVSFLAQPLVIVFAGEGSPDGLALASMIWFVFSADRMIRTGAVKWWGPASAFGALTAVTKLPFLMTAGLLTVTLLVITRPRAFRLWVMLGSAGLVSTLAFYAWTVRSDAAAAVAEYPHVEMRVSQSAFLSYWFFGDLAYRLGPMHWVKGGWRFLHGTLGSLAFTVLLVVGLLRRGAALPKLWLGAGLGTTLVFTHLVLEHWHYYLMVCPAVAMVCGGVISRLEERWEESGGPHRFWPALGVLALMLGSIQGLSAMKLAIDLDPYPREIAAQVQRHTTPGDKLLLYQCDPNWGGEVLFLADRQGLTVMELEGRPNGPSPKGLLDLLNNPQDLGRLKELGYSHLVMVSESPVRHAVEAARPGRTRERRFYPASITPEVDGWPEVYRSPELLIRRIP